ATFMILKAVSMSWLTVVRMMQVKGRFRSPEDLRETPFNPVPNPRQLEPNEYVERIRRIQLNDLENLPLFLVAAFLYVLTEPSLLLARLLLHGYVVSRLLHFAAYFTAQTHETRHVLDGGFFDNHIHDRPDLDCGTGILTATLATTHACPIGCAKREDP